jgi:hypothetical protein
MTRIDIKAALATTNTLTDQEAAMLPLREAEVELIQSITALPVEPGSGRPRWQSLLRHRFVLVLAVTSVVAAVMALLPAFDRTGGPQPAFAASLVRFANRSPLVLLRLPGWHVVYADEQAGGYGEMDFVRRGADAARNSKVRSPYRHESLDRRVASLTWGPVSQRTRRYLAAGREHIATGLGVDARRYVYEDSAHNSFDITAFLIYHGRELSFRATVTDMSMLRNELRALTSVDAATWLRAMPPSVVRTADRGEVIRHMLDGIPLPPGFDAGRIRGAGLIHDRYQLGAAVTGTVACMWIADWNHARNAHDRSMVKRAIAAMATAPRWPILRDMSRHGGWPQLLIAFARAMAHGTWHDRSLAGAVNAGLGCSGLGVKLGRG